MKRERRGRTYPIRFERPENNDDVITHLEPDILECKVKWAKGNIYPSEYRIPRKNSKETEENFVKCTMQKNSGKQQHGKD